MMNKLTIDDLDVKDKRVFLRVDFNVPLDDKQEVQDTTRIREAVRTIKTLAERGAKVCLFSHLGRPKSAEDVKYSLKPVLPVLRDLLNLNVQFSSDVLGEKAVIKINALKSGEVILMENIRFFPEEEKNDPEFSKTLAGYFDLYVNDAFGTAHRAHASTAGVAKHFKHAACGYLIQKEIQYLGHAVQNPKRPFTAILGGAKVKDKIKVINRLLDIADKILIGGGMAYTFLACAGHKIGNSLNQPDQKDTVEAVLKKAAHLNKEIKLPVDHIIADRFDYIPGEVIVEESPIDIKTGFLGMDIGPKTIEQYTDIVKQSGTVIWNGPMGVFETEVYQKGTFSIAKAMAESGATTIIGGGDSVSAINHAGLQDQMSHISTGGGASLEFLEGKTLPGIAVLADK